MLSEHFKRYDKRNGGPDFYTSATFPRHDSGTVSGVSSGASANSIASGMSCSSGIGRQGRKQRKIEESICFPQQKRRDHHFQCTWCYQEFNRKDAWKRHKESEHCPLGEYVCMLNGPTDDKHDPPIYVFCSYRGPSQEHLQSHKVNPCYSRPEAQRSFTRPDSLRQQLR